MEENTETRLRNELEATRAELARMYTEQHQRAERRARWRRRARKVWPIATSLAVWACLTLLVLQTCGCARPAAMSPTGAPRELLGQMRAAVRFEVWCISGDPAVEKTPTVKLYRGSGVLVDHRYVLTAKHVVRCTERGGAPLIHVIMADGRRVPARIDYQDPAHDLARVWLEDPVEAPPAPRLAEARAGDRVCIVTGYPLPGIRQCGRVTRIDSDNPWGEIHHEAPTIPGNSGSGVYDAAGNLVGIAASRPTDCKIPDKENVEGNTCGGSAALLFGRGMMP